MHGQQNVNISILRCGDRSFRHRFTGASSVLKQVLTKSLPSSKLLLHTYCVHTLLGHTGPEGEYKCSYTLSLTSALDEGGWSTSRPGLFTPGKETRYQLYMRMSESQGCYGLVRQISSLPCFDPQVVQPADSR